jgi:16S rRNA G966 N2-methylase RsmD
VPSPQRQALLFHPRALRDRLAAYTFPPDLEARRAKVLPWIDALRAGKIDEEKEVGLHGEFFGSIFGAVLGYRRVAESGAEGWELSAEKTTGGGNKSADGALGFFQKGTPGRVVAPIELKGARQSLDHALGRVLTPVQQAWDYANHSPGCRWIVVSNYRETRLYSPARTPDVYASFLLEDLADLDRFKELYFVLARENLLPAELDGTSRTDELLAASAKVEAEITKELYEEYKKLRSELYEHLARVHSNIPPLDLLGYTQTILDRFLFIAFAEDRGLLPQNTIGDACDHVNKCHPTSIWQNFQAVFRWIDEGNDRLGFPAYNGGLFALSPQVEALEVSDGMCQELKRLARYDFRDEISVDVLGHIFEQSITDLEEMRAAADEGIVPTEEKVSKRRKEGIFYTPASITRYIVDKTLGRVFTERFQAIYERERPDDRKKEKEKDQAWTTVWQQYREEIKTIRVLDLACGSGAFLVAAFEALSREYERVNVALAALRKGQIELADLTKTVLNNNLFGVDLNQESVEITKLSLWLKAAQRGRRVTHPADRPGAVRDQPADRPGAVRDHLDSNIKWGNSIVSDADIDRFAFDWRTGHHARAFLDPPTAPEAAEIDARWREGFDVVIGNPPYIRQELLGAIKPHLESNYRAYHGMADIYVYFFERGLHALKPGGRLGFIVANKWLKAGYGEPLRRLLAKETRIESLVDFGDAPIFPDADTFPCVVTVVKPANEMDAVDHALEVTTFPRELLHTISIPEYVARHRYPVPQRRLGGDSWSLARPEADALLQRLRANGTPLVEYAGARPCYGIKTGLNDAFLIDTATKERLARQDPAATHVFVRYLRGQDIARWTCEWKHLWLILIKSSGDHPWPWKGLSGPAAEQAFRAALPAIYEHMKPMEEALKKRTDHGQHWWELRSCAYYKAFEQPKIVYQEIQFRSAYACDDEGLLLNNKAFFLPSSDPWLLAVLNSPLMWWYDWRYLPHMLNETLTPVGAMMETLPIARPSAGARDMAAAAVHRLTHLTRANGDAVRAVDDSLRLQFDVEAAGQKLEDFASLAADAFLKEVLARRPKSAGKLKASDLKALRDLYDEQALPVQERRREALVLERRLSALVNEAYGLTPEEVELMWSTAPPRMPAGR